MRIAIRDALALKRFAKERVPIAMVSSPFESVSREDWLAENQLAFAFFDRFPVSPGHTLVVTKRVIPTWFDATIEEQHALMELVNQVKDLLEERCSPRPDGFNVGFNCGEAAGQTVMHLHLHVIPRYHGDLPDPRGGVRHVIPSKGNYLADRSGTSSDLTTPTQTLHLSTGAPDSPLWNAIAPRLPTAHSVDILASFVQRSGLEVIERPIFSALERGTKVRVLVSDYLTISDPLALRRLLGWSQSAEADRLAGTLESRLIEMTNLPATLESFHPKAWRIIDDQEVWIAVGSSNLSRAALQTGIEWNLLDRSTDADHASHRQFDLAYQSLWQLATPLDPSIIEAYALRAQRTVDEDLPPEAIDPRSVPEPRPWQHEALEALAALRKRGDRRALVAVATGMGKTWLAAFDTKQFGQSIAPKRPRVLVIAHRAQILAQAEATLSRLLDHLYGDGSTTWYLGDQRDLSGQLVVASIQKLARPEGLLALAGQHFDYALVDEVHHAHAPTYRRVLARLSSDFILGLTATPERSDGVDVASIFDDNLVYQATIGDGIAEDALVPFHYVGLKDTVDFRQIPWRNGRFDLEVLERQVAASERMERLWAAMQQHPAKRTILFCCSKRHALFARNWLAARGLSTAAVFSGKGSDPCGPSLQRLSDGQLDAICAVDLFNEGLDLPAVDRIVMLRPTESKVLFLQQLGRGLRSSPGKSRLLVIDFVGNHRIFAQRLVHLLSLGEAVATPTTLRQWLDGQPPPLPEGCLLDVELEAQDLLRQFLPRGAVASLEIYRSMREELGRRPLASELQVRGILLRTLAGKTGSFFGFVAEEGDLTKPQLKVGEQFAGWLRTVETTNLNKSYKMVVLRVLLDLGKLFEPIEVAELAKECREYLQRHPILRKDLEGEGHAIDHHQADDAAWAEWWAKWPIDRWCTSTKSEPFAWFQRDGSLFRWRGDCPVAMRQALESMTEELVDWRLLSYIQTRLTRTPASQTESFVGKVSHSSGRPILFLPDTNQAPGRPVGPILVTLPDGKVWEFKLVKVACNVAKPLGEKENSLGDLLQHWFGEMAGLPGTNFQVEFQQVDGQWHVKPLTMESTTGSPGDLSDVKASLSPITFGHAVALDSHYKTHLPVYDLIASAGSWGPSGSPRELGWMEVPGLPLHEGMFVARVAGRSMEPKIPDGSWCVFRPVPAGSRQNRLLLIQVNQQIDPMDGGRYTVKRYVSQKEKVTDSWQHASIQLQPLNPDYAAITLTPDQTADLRVLGEFVMVVTDSPARERK
jgi:superfamily II DNA or RNA helicase/diadenosine tetraphosphate (Ap4A) HIT family hydrolase/SOS-response transcriptional repressor LexA